MKIFAYILLFLSLSSNVYGFECFGCPSGEGAQEGTDVGFASVTSSTYTVTTIGDMSKGYCFGDGDTCLFESSDDVMKLAITGGAQWVWIGNNYYGSFTTSGGLVNTATSATVPTVLPARNDPDTGMGSAGANQLSLIAGGVETFRAHTTQIVTFPSGTGQVTITDEGNLSVDGFLSTQGTLSVDSNAVDTTAIATFENLSGSVNFFRVQATPEGSVTGARGDIAIGINGNNEGVMWVKHTGDGTNTGWGKMSISHYGEMHIHDNVVDTVISTVNVPHMIDGLFTGTLLDGFTFVAGSNGVMTAFAEYSTIVAGTTKVTDAGHGLSTGDNISMVGTTSYNGLFSVTVIDASNFYVTDTFVADDATGTWQEGDYLLANSGSAGNYEISQHGFGISQGTPSKNFEFEIIQNATVVEDAESQRTFANNSDIGTFAGAGLIVVEDGDRLSYAVIGLTDTSNYELNHVSFLLKTL